MGKEVTMENQGIDKNEERSQVSINIFHKDLSAPGQVYIGKDHADKDGQYKPTRHTWRRPEVHETMRTKLMEKSNSLAEV